MRQTDKQETVATEIPDGDGNPVFQNNPGKTADFINMKKHPYVEGECTYVNDCSRKDIKFTDRPYKSACEICLFAKQYHKNRSRITSNQVEYESLLKDENYKNVQFNPQTGGLQATHVDHNFDPTRGIFGILRGDYERLASDVLYKYGRKVILASERAGSGIKTPDGFLDGSIMDIKAIEGTGKSTMKNKFISANKQGVESVVLYYHDQSVFSMNRLEDGYRQFLRANKENGVKNIYYIVEDKLYRFK